MNLALEAAEEGIYIWDITQNIIHYTERCLSMMGYAPGEEAPNIFTQSDLVVFPEDRAFFKQEVRRFLENSSHIRPMRLEIRILNHTSNGAWMWVRVNGKAQFNKQGKPTSLVGVFVDITRRKSAEMRAQEERELFRVLINHIPNNIYVKNRSSRFVMANEATARKLNVPIPSDIIGKTDADFFDQKMCEISRREELEIMETGKSIIGRVQHETWQNGKETWGMVSKFPWFGRNGQLKGIVGISSDVTKLVLAEQEVKKTAQILKERNDTLEKEIDLAREIQLALLPYEIPNRSYQASNIQRKVTFNHIFTPSEGVAGDWFDVFPIGDTGTGVIICDVMGHGIRSALIASMLKGIMEQLFHISAHPEKVLHALNHQLTKILARTNITMFATAVYAYIDLQMKTITMASAGHPFPILLNHEGHGKQITLPKGMALGLLDNVPYKCAEFHLSAGDRFLLFTDGLTEATNSEGDELGVDRVIQALEHDQPKTTKELVFSTLKCTGKFTHCSALADDICLLGIRYDETSDDERASLQDIE